MVLGVDAIRQRQSRYLLDHYMNLHAALVSVAVGVAGLAAANILTADFGWQTALRLAMLGASLLLTANIYLGMMVGGLIFPGGGATVWDFIFPLLVGVAEFAMFGFLVVSVKDGVPESPFSAVRWLLAVVCVCALAALAVVRACQHIVRDRYDDHAWLVAEEYKAGLRGDIAGIGAGLVFALIGAVWTWVGLPIIGTWIALILIYITLIIGVICHQQAANRMIDGLKAAGSGSGVDGGDGVAVTVRWKTWSVSYSFNRR